MMEMIYIIHLAFMPYLESINSSLFCFSTMSPLQFPKLLQSFQCQRFPPSSEILPIIYNPI